LKGLGKTSNVSNKTSPKKTNTKKKKRIAGREEEIEKERLFDL